MAKEYFRVQFLQFRLGLFAHGFPISASFRSTYSAFLWVEPGRLHAALMARGGVGHGGLGGSYADWPPAWARQSHRVPGSLSSTLVGFLGA